MKNFKYIVISLVALMSLNSCQPTDPEDSNYKTEAAMMVYVNAAKVMNINVEKLDFILKVDAWQKLTTIEAREQYLYDNLSGVQLVETADTIFIRNSSHSQDVDVILRAPGSSISDIGAEWVLRDLLEPPGSERFFITSIGAASWNVVGENTRPFNPHYISSMTSDVTLTNPGEYTFDVTKGELISTSSGTEFSIDFKTTKQSVIELGDFGNGGIVDGDFTLQVYEGLQPTDEIQVSVLGWRQTRITFRGVTEMWNI